MNLLPNDHHPGPRCSCAECLREYPDAQPTSNSRLTDGDLAKIIQRDAMAGATWFTGPPSFTALAAQDRRALIEDLCALRAERASLEPPTAAPNIAAIRAVIAEMIAVAANGDRDEADWTADNCYQIDKWQVRLADAIATQPPTKSV